MDALDAAAPRLVTCPPARLGQEHLVGQVGEAHPGGVGCEAGEHGVGAGELPRVGGAGVHQQIGELGLSHRRLRDGPFVGAVSPPAQVRHATLGQHRGAGGVVEPGPRVEGRDDTAQVRHVGDDDVVDQHVPQRPAHVLGLQCGVEVQHDALRPAGFDEGDQLGEQVLPQRAGDAAVGELEPGRDVVVAAAEPAVHDAGTFVGADVAQVVMQDGDLGVEGADAADHGLGAGPGQPGQDEELGAGHGTSWDRVRSP